MTPAEIITQVCAAQKVEAVLLRGGDRSSRMVAVRHALAFRLVIEEGNAPGVIAPMIGFADRTGARHAALVEGRSRGFKATTIEAMRRRVWADTPADDLDWTKLAYRVAGWRAREDLLQDQAAKRSGVARRQIVAAERGEAVSAFTLVKLCNACGLDPRDLLPRFPVSSRETEIARSEMERVE